MKIRCQQCGCSLEEIHFGNKQPCEFCIADQKQIEENKKKDKNEGK